MSSTIYSDKSIIATVAPPVATMRFNRPEKLNALTSEMRAGLLEALDKIESVDEIRVIVLTGEGRGFCAGGDIDYLRQLKKTGDRDGFCRILEEGSVLVQRFRSSPRTIIAAINGPAVGGGLILALACDLRVAAETAVFGMPFAKIGMGPDWGGSWMLTCLVGSATALEMFLTAQLFSAREALACGLVNHICPPDVLDKKVQELAGQAARFDLDVSARYKQVVYAVYQGDFEHAMAVERRCQLEFFDHPEFVERLNRFLPTSTKSTD